MALDIRNAVRKGGEAAEEMADLNKPSGSFEKINWFGLKKPGDTIIIRMLDDYDEWPSVLQHSFVPTKGAPSNATDQQKQNWPKNFGAVCRKTPEFVQYFEDGCYICDHMRGNGSTKDGRYYPQPRLWARAVEREEVFADEELAAKYDVPVGEALGYRDATVEVEETDSEGKATGKKTRKKKILVINMALSNFFSPFKGYGDVYKTVLDRDYHIRRKGEGKNTDYDIVPLDPTMTTDASGKEVKWDLRLPELVDGQETGRARRDAYLDDAPDLFKLIEDRLDDDLYHRFFDERVDYKLKVKSDDNSSQDESSDRAPAAAASPAPSSNGGGDEASKQEAKDRLKAMRDKVKGDHPSPSGTSDSAPGPDEAKVASASVSFD